MIKAGEFNNIFTSKNGVPRIDAISNLLKSISLNVLREIINRIIKKAVRNKVLDGGTIDGLNVVAIDGKIYSISKVHIVMIIY